MVTYTCPTLTVASVLSELVWNKTASEGYVDDYRKDRKEMQETDMEGLQVITTPATSVFLRAFLYYNTLGSKATS